MQPTNPTLEPPHPTLQTRPRGVEHLRFPPAGGGEQRTALLATIQVGSRLVTVAATHLSNNQGHNVRRLRGAARAG